MRTVALVLLSLFVGLPAVMQAKTHTHKHASKRYKVRKSSARAHTKRASRTTRARHKTTLNH